MKTQRILSYLAGLKPRERILLAACALVFLFIILEFAIARPQRLENKRVQAEIERTNAEVSALTQVLQVARANSAPDLTKKLRADRDQMAAAIHRAETILKSSSGPGSLDSLHTLVAAQGGVKLVALRTIAPEMLSIAPSSPAPATQRAASGNASPAAPLLIFRSAVEVTVQGTYPALAAFLSSVEREAPQLLWGEVNLDTIAYPESRLKLTLYSLDTRPTGLVE